MKRERNSSFIRKSRYLFLYLSSVSVIPCHFSGNGKRDFEAITQESTTTLCSPVFERAGFPVTEIKSPIATVSKKREKFSSDMISFCVYGVYRRFYFSYWKKNRL